MSGKLALINNIGVVENTIVVNDDYVPSEGYTAIPIDGLSVSIGDTWDGEKFISAVFSPLVPEPTAEDYLIDLDFRLSVIELGVN